jgi:hypothetical protein
MSSVNYGNEGGDDTTNPTGSVIQHPYINPNAYAAVAAAVSSTSSNVGQYPHYYAHPLPPQQLLHVQQTAGFYPTTGLNHHQHHAEFSNSSPSVASSSSSIESSRKTTNRKRNIPTSEKLPGTMASTKTNAKRKLVCYTKRKIF